MLQEYKRDRKIWKFEEDINLRSDILGTKRILKMLKNLEGTQVLDLGCANGKVARYLAHQGAFVVGVDLVEEQIELCKKLTPIDLNVEFYNKNIVDPLNLERKFDLILGLMVFLYLNEDEFKKSIKNLSNDIKSGGIFYYLDIHPSRLMQDNPDLSYFDSHLLSTSLSTNSGITFNTTYYHHPLELVCNTITDSGFNISRIHEPQPSKQELEEYPELFQGNNLFPKYLIIEAVKHN